MIEDLFIFFIIKKQYIYLFGKPAETVITNNTITDGKKILILRDSFAQVVAPFLALGTHEVDLICDQKFSGSICSYIRENKPDVILIIYSSAYDPIQYEHFH